MKTFSVDSPRLIEFAKYTAISSSALALDYAVYWLIATSGRVGVGMAAAIGYFSGLALAYPMMRSRLFKDGWLASRKGVELALFILSGLIGIALTYLIAEAYVRLVQHNLHAAKIAAIIVSFVTVYAFRRYVVFRPAHPVAGKCAVFPPVDG